ncbi:MAG: hypothetical protein IKW38_01925 [Kiritimatiellae bacterium]|nr:hypothetical protein [Kiritimatiellia bacterium]
MNRTLGCLLCCGLLLVGCRRVDWKEALIEPATGVDFVVLQQALQALDNETPPEVQMKQGMVFVRYNSMRISVRNLTYVRDELAAAAKQERAK